MSYALKVIGSYQIKGRGLVVTGPLEADGEPATGPCSITLPSGKLLEGYVAGWEHYAIVHWWTSPAGALLRGMVKEEIPLGSIIRGQTK